jgi:hypothetical protein
MLLHVVAYSIARQTCVPNTDALNQSPRFQPQPPTYLKDPPAKLAVSDREPRGPGVALNQPPDHVMSVVFSLPTPNLHHA